MNDSLILRTTAKLLIPLMILFSIFLLFRGHDESGGGFIGGLVGGSAFALYAAAYGTLASRRALRVSPLELMSVGLGIALMSGIPGIIAGQGLLAGLWFEIEIGEFFFKSGTPILFDIGVYMLVVGTVLTVIYELDDSGAGLFPPEGLLGDPPPDDESSPAAA